MKSTAVYFAVPNDIKTIGICSKHLSTNIDEVFVCVNKKDKNIELPPELSSIITFFDYSRGLNGFESIFGMKYVFRQLFETGTDIIVKIDKNDYILDVEKFIIPIEMGCDYVFGKKPGQFNSYSFSKYAFSKIDELPFEKTDEILKSGGTDVEIFKKLFDSVPSLAKCEISERKVYTKDKPYCNMDCILMNISGLSDVKAELIKVNPIISNVMFPPSEPNKTRDSVSEVFEIIPESDKKSKISDNNEIIDIS